MQPSAEQNKKEKEWEDDNYYKVIENWLNIALGEKLFRDRWKTEDLIEPWRRINKEVVNFIDFHDKLFVIRSKIGDSSKAIWN